MEGIMLKKNKTIINQDPFDAAMARWERRGNIIAWGLLAAAVCYFAPVVLRILFNH
jgi:hypothetical protein